MMYKKELTELLQYWEGSNLPEGQWQTAMLYHAQWMQKRSRESVDREGEHRWTTIAHYCKCYAETGGFVFTNKSLKKELEKL